MRRIIHSMTAIAFVAAALSAPAMAKGSDDNVELVKCEQSYGTVAITDGDTQGWTQFNLSSPRAMIGAMVTESGCFTLHNPASGGRADFLISAVAGSEEEIDQTMNMAKGLATEGLVRSGAAGAVLSKVPFGGSMLGMFGGLGGKKKTISAGLRLMDPANGMTVLTGTGASQKTSIKVLGRDDWVAASQGSMGQYASSKDGKLVTSAFIGAFNTMVSQAGALANYQPAQQAAPASSNAMVAVDTVMRAGPSAEASTVRTLRADTELVPTGNREGLFVEVKDNYGTQGWVSVEDLQ
ncbi:MAG: SH3 domain-containing protein [Blastomonas sp.]